MSHDDWITTNEAAELSGYHPHYVRWLINEGRIEARKFGRTWMVNRPALDRFVEAGAASGDGRRVPKTRRPIG